MWRGHQGIIREARAPRQGRSSGVGRRMEHRQKQGRGSAEHQPLLASFALSWLALAARVLFSSVVLPRPSSELCVFSEPVVSEHLILKITLKLDWKFSCSYKVRTMKMGLSSFVITFGLATIKSKLFFWTWKDCINSPYFVYILNGESTAPEPIWEGFKAQGNSSSLQISE